MSRVKALLEDQELSSILSENEAILEQSTAEFNEWFEVMTTFVTENIEEFLDESLDETKKNVYTFATFATSQFLAETANRYGRQIYQSEVIKEAQEHEFV
jgi:hypothetical protein